MRRVLIKKVYLKLALRIIAYICEVTPPAPPPPHPLKGRPNNSAFLSNRCENFATKLWESVGKGHLYERVISAGMLE